MNAVFKLAEFVTSDKVKNRWFRQMLISFRRWNKEEGNGKAINAPQATASDPLQRYIARESGVLTEQIMPLVDK